MSELERTIVVTPAYDCIVVQPCKFGSERCIAGGGGRHGRHNAEMHMTLAGPDTEVTLVISTGWCLPETPVGKRLSDIMYVPNGMRVEFHTARPWYDGQEGGEPQENGTCKDWNSCYSDVGYSMAEEPAKMLAQKGSEAVWEWLEEKYNSTRADMDKLSA